MAKEEGVGNSGNRPFDHLPQVAALRNRLAENVAGAQRVVDLRDATCGEVAECHPENGGTESEAGRRKKVNYRKRLELIK